MSSPEPTPPGAAQRSSRAGLDLPAERRAAASATAERIQAVVAVLRELHLGDTPPGAAYRAGGEHPDAAV